MFSWLALTPLLLVLGLHATPDGLSRELKSLTYVRNCTLLNFNGSIQKTFPGLFCLFLDDGRFVSANSDEMAMFDKSSKKLWSIPGHFHHQINFTNDKRSILALGSVAIEKANRRLRHDRFLKITLDGQIVADQQSDWILKQAKVRFDPWPLPESVPHLNTAFEGSHFNSIYEIPKNSKSSAANYLSAGNIIVNSVKAGIFVLNQNLSQVMAHWVLAHSHDHHVHDVQVTKTGELFYFNNRNFDDPIGLYSSVEYWDPISKLVTYRFTANPKQLFYSTATGSVQELDNDTILFTDQFKGGFFIRKNEKQLLASVPQFSADSQFKTPFSLQQAKGLDLRSFLRHWQ